MYAKALSVLLVLASRQRWPEGTLSLVVNRDCCAALVLLAPLEQLPDRDRVNDLRQVTLGVIRSYQRRGNAMSDDDMKAELERLRRENAALKKGASDGIRMKVSEKGAVSVYGMGRFPVTLYKEQWLKLLNMSDEMRAFIAENEAQLKAKD
jgi:hypothetical protein